MKKIIFLFTIFATLPLFSQANENTNHFKMVRDAVGDLNKDGLQDKVILSMNTKDATQPLKLQIFFLGQDRKFKSAFSSTEVFDPQYPNGKYGGNQVPDIHIENNNLIIYKEIGDVKEQQTFRFNKGKFELIAISKVKWDGKETTIDTKIDLLTGTVIEITQILGSKKAKKNQKKITVNALPTLENIRSFDVKIP
ncbi:hypothetical protein OF897_04130 [Chryseobacterium formosus]|uniref:VCBS repeat-containing protein n=1 Tax=Chryseobacterium formosus TaxID=1537363 RepID=A0ABT3XLW6_9FLAO|nr:hypothetical protein [Chryseobacterium formosus]MCX8523109.1 hypothetical protein [Chryseobacterium formosus]